jgi:hypothetical protein
MLLWFEFRACLESPMAGIAESSVVRMPNMALILNQIDLVHSINNRWTQASLPRSGSAEWSRPTVHAGARCFQFAAHTSLALNQCGQARGVSANGELPGVARSAAKLKLNLISSN